MFLSAVRFRTPKNDTLRTWRVEAGSGKFRNFLVFCESPQILGEIEAALAYGLTNEKNPLVAEVALQLSDDQGDSWIIERNADRLRILRNGKPLASDGAEAQLLFALLDQNLNGNNLNATSDMALQTWRLSQHQHGWEALPWHQAERSKRSYNDKIHNRLQMLLNELGASSAAFVCGDALKLVTLQAKIDPIYQEFRQLVKLRAHLLPNSTLFDHLDPATSHQLDREVETIDEIHHQARTLLDPSLSPKSLQDKLRHVEEDLQRHLTEIQVLDLQVTGDSLPWDEISKALCQKIVYEHLIKAMAQVDILATQEGDILSTRLLGIVETFLKEDRTIMQELQNSVEYIHAKTQVPAPLSEKQPWWDGLWSKREKLTTAAQPAQPLGVSRTNQAVDIALTALGELQSDVVDLNDRMSQARGRQHNWQDKLRDEHAKVTMAWHDIAQRHQLPASMTLSTLLRLIQRFQSITDLRAQRTQLRNQLSLRLGQLQRLEALVKNWHQMTSSHKDIQTPNAPILLAEVQAILRLRDKKTRDLARLKEMHDLIHAHHAIRQQLDNRSHQLTKDWQAVFTELRLEPAEITAEWWPAWFESTRQVRTLVALSEEQAKVLCDQQIFSDQHRPMSAVLSLTREDFSNEARHEFLRLIQHHSTTFLNILLVADVALASLVKALGSSQARGVGVEPRVANAAKVPTVSSRTQAIVNMLNGTS